MRNSGKMTIGKTHTRLQVEVNLFKYTCNFVLVAGKSMKHLRSDNHIQNSLSVEYDEEKEFAFLL